MDTLDDNFNPPNPSNTETSPSIGRILLIMGYVLIGFNMIFNLPVLCLILNEHKENNTPISINTIIVYTLVLLLLPFAIATYLVMLGNRFYKLNKEHSPERYTKLLSLKIQLLLTLSLWLIMVSCLVLGYVRM